MDLAKLLKAVFLTLRCFMIATIVYTLCTDGSPFRKSLLTPWMTATLIDFYINVAALSAWLLYKESSILSAILWILLFICFGSASTCVYVFSQLVKLSNEESFQDPIYYVLLRKEKKDALVEVKRPCTVANARIVFIFMGFLMLGTLIYTIITDGSPFRKELLTPWMVATLIDFYINVFALSVWIAYKECCWITAVMWILGLICFGSVATCVYIVVELLRISGDSAAFLVLFKGASRPGCYASCHGSEPNSHF